MRMVLVIATDSMHEEIPCHHVTYRPIEAGTSFTAYGDDNYILASGTSRTGVIYWKWTPEETEGAEPSVKLDA